LGATAVRADIDSPWYLAFSEVFALQACLELSP